MKLMSYHDLKKRIDVLEDPYFKLVPNDSIILTKILMDKIDSLEQEIKQIKEEQITP